MSRVSQEAKFASRLEKCIPVPETGCLLWPGKWNNSGYGVVKLARERGTRKQKTESAHRYFYEKRFGPIPAGLVVCHRCDTPACVNTNHLFLGTQADNIRDARDKGRFHRRRTRRSITDKGAA